MCLELLERNAKKNRRKNKGKQKCCPPPTLPPAPRRQPPPRSTKCASQGPRTAIGGMWEEVVYLIEIQDKVRNVEKIQKSSRRKNVIDKENMLSPCTISSHLWLQRRLRGGCVFWGCLHFCYCRIRLVHVGNYVLLLFACNLTNIT